MFIVPITPMPSIASLEETLKVSQPVQSAGSALPFSEVFRQAIETVQETQAISQQDAYDLAMGKSDDLHTVMINSEKAVTAIEMTVQLATRALAAYNEIMRMQV